MDVPTTTNTAPLSDPVDSVLLRLSTPQRFDSAVHRADEFLASVSKFIRCCSTDCSGRKMVKTAVMLFDTVADRWWEALPRQPDSDWNEFRTLFLQRFRPVSDELLARSELDRLSFDGKNGDIGQFANKFQHVMARLPHMHESDRIHAWVRVLSPSLRRIVACGMHQTLSDAINAAVLNQGLWESATPNLNDHRNRMPRMTATPTPPSPPRRSQPSRYEPRSSFVRSPPSPPTPVPMANLGSLTRLTEEERQRCFEEGLCFRCRKPGHSWRRCPSTLPARDYQSRRKFRPFDDQDARQ